jgi:hypothetical protein
MYFCFASLESCFCVRRKLDYINSHQHCLMAERDKQTLIKSSNFITTIILSSCGEFTQSFSFYCNIQAKERVTVSRGANEQHYLTYERIALRLRLTSPGSVTSSALQGNMKYAKSMWEHSTATRSHEEHIAQKLLNIHCLGQNRLLFNNTVSSAQVTSIVVKGRDVFDRQITSDLIPKLTDSEVIKYLKHWACS